MDAMTTTPQEERDSAARLIIGKAGWWNEGEDLETASYDESLYGAGAAEFLILTDEEADEKAEEYIKDSLWAFNASFIVSYVPDGVTEDVIQMIGEKCEAGNDAMAALIGDRLEEFISDAISSDGRGHFLASYDDEELEEKIGDTYWYGYRTN